MTRQTELNKLLDAAKFREARELFQAQLLEGTVLDPRDDQQWGPFANRIALAIRKAQGDRAAVQFWEALRDFFINEIERVWGRVHKAHIYFRLGLSRLVFSISKGKEALEEVLREAEATEQAKGSSSKHIEQRLLTSRSYTALAILERVEDENFADVQQKQKFLGQLFRSLDAAFHNQTFDPEVVEESLTTIVPDEGLSASKAINKELIEASLRRLRISTVSLTGTLLESIILADLCYTKKRETLRYLERPKPVLQAELGELLREAKGDSLFPSESIQVACELVGIFRNRLHPGNEMRRKYKLTIRTAQTIKMLFEIALVDWSMALPQKQQAGQRR